MLVDRKLAASHTQTAAFLQLPPLIWSRLARFVQIPYRYDPIAGIPPLERTGYYYLPPGWENTSLPVMVLFHGLEGYGLNILSSGSEQTFQVRRALMVEGPGSRVRGGAASAA